MSFNPPSGLTTVDQLNRSVLKGSVFNDIVREQLFIIDKKIVGYNKRLGENEVLYDLPVTFPNIQADRTDTRIMVYYWVMQDLEKRGYKVKIKLTEAKSTLTITWTIGLEVSDLTKMETYLQTKSVD